MDLHAVVKSRRRVSLHISSSEKSTVVTKSLRLISSINGCAGSNPRGGRDSDSPPISSFDFFTFCQAALSFTIVLRTFASVPGSGCQSPEAAKHRPGDIIIKYDGDCISLP